jgi:hypothetical protein
MTWQKWGSKQALEKRKTTTTGGLLVPGYNPPSSQFFSTDKNTPNLWTEHA